MLTEKLAMFPMRIAILQKGRGVTPTDKVTGHRQAWPIGGDSALLLEQVFRYFEGTQNNALRAQYLEGHNGTCSRVSVAYVGREYALAIYITHGSQCFVRRMCPKVEQVSDKRPSRWARRERRAPPGMTYEKV